MASRTMVKLAVLFWVQSHANVFGDEEEYFRRLYTGTCERTFGLLLSMINRRTATSDDSVGTSPKHDLILAEIQQDIGAGPLLRAIITALRFSRFMDGFPQLSDCLVACTEFCLDPEDTSFKDIYLQLPMLQEISAALLRPNMPVPLTRDPYNDESAMEAYRSAWVHLSCVTISETIRRGRLLCLQHHRFSL